MGETRVGLGFDVHPRDESQPLLLAGVPFEGVAGLAGHSDADVVCHALAEALLGSLALGDLGDHFPEGAPETAGMPGLRLLEQAVRAVRDGGWTPVSCDLTVIAEEPAIAPRRSEMRANLARVLAVSPGRVSVKATRPEGLGLRGEGVGCLALATVATP